MIIFTDNTSIETPKYNIPFTRSLTLGKTYNIINEDQVFYTIKSDYGDLLIITKRRFKTLSEVRKNKLKKIC